MNIKPETDKIDAATGKAVTSPTRSLPPSSDAEDAATGAGVAWYETEAAQELLRSCVSNPPQTKNYRDYDPHNSGKMEFSRFVGERVDQLEAIRNSFGEAALKASDEQGDDNLLLEWMVSPTPEQAINDAIAAYEHDEQGV